MGNRTANMNCPPNDLLLKFIDDPDATVAESPWFEAHLEHCARCRAEIDKLSASQSAPTLWIHVLGDKSAPSRSLPEIAGYQIENWVGTGGYGSVYRAIQLSTGRSVAVKFISRLDPSQANRLLTEQSAMLRLDHPHIVALLDAGTTSTGVYIVYAWMKTNLSNYMKEIEPAELIEVLNLLIPICEAVCHLHSHQIIHRDIKPSNLLLNDHGQPKLTDFGLAKDLSENQSSTMTEPVGTPGYMAPEQTGLVEERVGYETDVYGLGALMYAMTAGRPPFQAANSLHVIHQVIHDLPVPLRRLRPDVSIDYETVCMKCLNKRKQERYSSADELLADLRRLQRGDRVMARPASILRKGTNWIARRPVVRNSLLSCVTLILVCIVWFMYAQRRFEDRARRDLQTLTVERLLNADAGELTKIFSSLNNQPTAEVVETLHKFDGQSGPGKLRLALASPAPLPWQTLLDGIEQCQVDDLVPIRTQLLGTHRFDEETRKQVNEYLRTGNNEENLLRLVAVCPQDQIERFDDQICTKLLMALSDRNATELPVWQHCLRSEADVLTEQLLQLLDTPSDTPLTALQLPVNLCLLWNRSQPERSLQLLEHGTAETLLFLNSHTELLTAPLKELARRRWHTLLEFEERGWQDTTPSEAIVALAERYHGATSSRGGCLTLVPAEHLQYVFRELIQFGYAATSTYPVLDQECSAYSVCFRRSTANCELDRYQTPDDLLACVRQKQSDGWYPASVWTHPASQELTVLWNSSQEFAGSLLEYDSTSPDWNAESFASQMPAAKSALTFNWNQRGFGFQRNLLRADKLFGENVNRGLPTGIRIPLDGDKPNFSRIYLDREPLERFVRSSQIQQFNIVSHDLIDFQHKLSELLRFGLLPCDVFVDSNYSVRAFCELNRHQAESIQWCRAVSALTCWICGDREPLLADLKCRPFAHVRGTLIGELPRLSPDIELLFRLVARANDPDQINGLLVASGALAWNRLENKVKMKIGKQLRTLALHNDSGVHFAAKWLLKTKLHSDLDATTLASRGPTTEHRSWFYSASGIPFVVINPQEVQVITDDLQTPWTQAVLSDAVHYRRPFAISATEIPLADVKRYVSTVQFPRPQGSDFGKEPAALVNYKTILDYCHKLSEHEGVPADQLGSIVQSAGKVSVNERFLDCDGYRLPTAIEWEIACRCGTLTSTFFGDNSTYLSTYAWNSDNTKLTTKPIAMLAPSPWGFHDILGNVYEANLGSTTSHEEAMWKRSEVDYRVDGDMSINVRGGSFLSNRVYCASGTRHGIQHFSHDRNAGFRIVRVLRPSGNE